MSATFFELRYQRGAHSNLGSHTLSGGALRTSYADFSSGDDQRQAVS